MKRALMVIGLMAAPALLAAEFPPPAAGDLRDLQTRSLYLRRESPGDPRAGDRFAIIGFGVNQEGGKLIAGADQIQVSRAGKATLIHGLKIETPLAIDDAYLNNPIGGLFAALVTDGELRIDRIDTGSAGAASASPAGRRPSAPATSRVRDDGVSDEPVGVKEVRLRFSSGAFVCTMKLGFVRARASGTAAYDPSTRRLLLEFREVSAGVPVGLERLFAILKDALDFDWTVVDQPNVSLVFDEMFR